MKKKGRTAFPYALLRTEVVLFLVLLALAVAAIAQYPRLCLSLGQRALQAGEEEKAVRLLERADSEEATALLRSIRTAQAERLIDEGDYEEAQALLAELSVTDPDDARVAACLYGRAMASMDRGAYEEAMDLLSSIPGHRDAGEQRRRCEKALAQQAFQAGEWDTALLYVRMNPQDQEMQAIATAIRRQDALDRLSSEDPEAGLALLRQLWQEGEDVEADLLTALRRCYPDLYQDKDDAVLLQELRQMDDLASSVSPIHSLHPLAKLIVTISYVLATVSFDRYELTALSGMILYPAALFALSGIPVRTCLHKLRFVLPLVLAVGLFNPLLDRTPLFRLGTVTVTGGVVSMLSLMCKGAFCLAASFLLAATTPIDALCAALRRVRVPSFLVTLLLLTYRYVSVMLDEVSVMTTAYRLRAPGQKGIHVSAWGSFLGQLLLRSMDRAQSLYESMLLRGFAGEFRYAEGRRAGLRDWIFVLICLSAFALCRFVDLPALIGGLLVR